MAPTKKDKLNNQDPPKPPPKGCKKNQDGSWLILATYQSTNGKRRFAERTLPAHLTEEQVRQERERLILSLKTPPPDLDAPFILPDTIPTLGVYSLSWLKVRAARVREVTAQNYALYLTKHVLPKLGHKTLDKIRRIDLESYKSYLEKESGQSVRSQKQIWNIALMVIRDGWADYELLDRSARLSAPKGEIKPAGKALTYEELQNLINVAKDKLNIADQALILTLIYTGLRRKEAQMLLRKDLHLEELNPYLEASHSKTEKGRGRRIYLPNDLVEILNHHLQIAPNSKYVFVGRAEGQPVGEQQAILILKKINSHVGKITPHDLRRSIITLAVMEGVPRPLIRDTYGQSRDNVTDLYVRPSDEQKKSVLKVIEGGLKRGEG